MSQWETWKDRPQGGFALIGYWLKKLFWVGASCHCPRCEQGAMFETFFGIRERCPVCRIKFQPYEGDSPGVIAVGYFLTLLPTIVLVLLAYAYLELSPEALLGLYLGLTAFFLFAFFRNMKGIWVAFVYLLTGLRRNL